MKENTDPKMHTAEHLLNQTMVRMLKTGRCFSAHIERKKSKCDYHFNRVLTGEEIRALESAINGVIRANLPVTEEYVLEEEARAIYAEYGTDKLPPNSSKDYRVIKIGDYDRIPCSGPHIANTLELGNFRIISSSFENGVLRIRYKLS